MENETISVLMGIYNCADTLPEAIDSILRQTYPDWQLILCDDCSTDDTYEVARSYQEQYPDKIILIRNETNSRLAYTLNHCLENATGKYLARMDGDDISVPERFEKELTFLRQHPEYDLVGCAMQRFSSEDGLADVVQPSEYVDKYSIRNGPPFCHATIMTYKRVYDALGGYTVSKRTMRAQDYDLWFRFFAAGYRGHNLPEALYLVREDMNAIKRRTFQVRWNAFRTTVIGYRLLGFPKRWLIKKFFRMILKSLVPYRLIYWIRRIQAKKGDPSNTQGGL